jgi:hypothetical protein
LTTVAAIAPLQGGAMPPAGFTLSPSTLDFSVATGTSQFQLLTLTTKGQPVVFQNPTTATDPVFQDTQAGTCWQSYEALGNKIPKHTSCTIQIGFHPNTAGTYSATLTVSRCTSWHIDPTFGFILCDATDGSQTVTLNGTGT